MTKDSVRGIAHLGGTILRKGIDLLVDTGLAERVLEAPVELVLQRGDHDVVTDEAVVAVAQVHHCLEAVARPDAQVIVVRQLAIGVTYEVIAVELARSLFVR